MNYRSRQVSLCASSVSSVKCLVGWHCHSSSMSLTLIYHGPIPISFIIVESVINELYILDKSLTKPCKKFFWMR